MFNPYYIIKKNLKFKNKIFFAVACSTVTVTKCQAALRTLQAFPFFKPTCLCKEPNIDPECNSFRDFLFDHPCVFVLKKGKGLRSSFLCPLLSGRPFLLNIFPGKLHQKRYRRLDNPIMQNIRFSGRINHNDFFCGRTI